jgi:hypothetical protein
MSQEVHFQRLKCFSEEFTKQDKYDEVLAKVKACLESHKSNDKIDDETINKYFEDITTKSNSMSAYEAEIEKFLTGEAKLLLYDRYYFVDEEIWQVFEEEIYNYFKKDIEDRQSVLDRAEDYAVLKKCFESKLLAFEAS